MEYAVPTRMRPYVRTHEQTLVQVRTNVHVHMHSRLHLLELAHLQHTRTLANAGKCAHSCIQQNCPHNRT